MTRSVIEGDAARLWDGVAPGSEGWTWEERTLELGELRFVFNVVEPTITPVLPDTSEATGAAVLVCPGGGYGALAIDHEGLHVARWLAERGVAAFVLRYRVMMTAADDVMGVLARAAEPDGLTEILRQMDDFAPIPLADGIAALGMIRDRADDWNIDKDRIGGLGFSAGARLAVELAGQRDQAKRPAFVGAIYGPPLDWVVPDDAPPLFVAAAADDPLFDGSVGVHAAWRAAGRPAEAHLFERGGHGFGMMRQGLPCDEWIEQFHCWLMSR